ncbi:hypothetical protein C7Y47_00600 [Lysinibacillus sphaericus]|uniref:Uncharacterized protein n=1 Tax=Lysinibacillus sphaericus TaxID=1421 RepID=A0A544V0D9_LYSSH|nr:hypothetical protein [Lysinibacillus sp. SDF0037]TQR39571.1 hypothetical protein C7Y47_00600 [Lysinibacillus sp. SDF0037]
MKDENLRAAFDTWEETSYQSRLKYMKKPAPATLMESIREENKDMNKVGTRANTVSEKIT